MMRKSKQRQQEESRRKKLMLGISLALVTAVVALGVIAVVRSGILTPGEMPGSSESSIESSENASDSTSLAPVLGPTATPLPTATPTPSPTPTPEIVYITSLSGYSAGDVIGEEYIDKDNMWQYFVSYEIEEGGTVYNRIYGQSYVENSNISLSSLRYLKLLHVNFDGEYQVGELIVNKSVADDVLEIFQQLCEDGYQIEKMHLIDDYWTGDASGSDWNSIDHNNTSAFCYRAATGGGNLSKHALGLAIDINPQQNPYVTFRSDGTPKYSHENAADYVTGRSSDMPHVITKSDEAYKLFVSYGWTWGGNWSSPKDYQHFQISG